MRTKDLNEIINNRILELKEENAKLDSKDILDAATICFNSGTIFGLEWLEGQIKNDKVAQVLKRIPHLDHEEQEEEAMEA